MPADDEQVFETLAATQTFETLEDGDEQAFETLAATQTFETLEDGDEQAFETLAATQTRGRLEDGDEQAFETLAGRPAGRAHSNGSATTDLRYTFDDQAGTYTVDDGEWTYTFRSGPDLRPSEDDVVISGVFRGAVPAGADPATFVTEFGPADGGGTFQVTADGWYRIYNADGVAVSGQFRGVVPPGVDKAEFVTAFGTEGGGTFQVTADGGRTDFNGAGRPILHMDGQGVVTRYSYDDAAGTYTVDDGEWTYTFRSGPDRRPSEDDVVISGVFRGAVPAGADPATFVTEFGPADGGGTFQVTADGWYRIYNADGVAVSGEFRGVVPPGVDKAEFVTAFGTEGGGTFQVTADGGRTDFNGAGRPILHMDGQGVVTRYSYDDAAGTYTVDDGEWTHTFRLGDDRRPSEDDVAVSGVFRGTVPPGEDPTKFVTEYGPAGGGTYQVTADGWYRTFDADGVAVSGEFRGVVPPGVDKAEFVTAYGRTEGGGMWQEYADGHKVWFDSSDRPVKITEPGKGDITIEHLSDGTRIVTQDGTHTLVDSQDRKLEEWTTDRSQSTKWTYHQDGSFTVTSPDGRSTTYSKDGHFIKTVIPDPNGGPPTVIEWAVEMPALLSAAQNTRRLQAKINDEVNTLKTTFGGITDAWKSPSGDSFHSLSRAFLKASDELSETLSVAATRMQKSYDEYAAAEAASVAALTPK